VIDPRKVVVTFGQDYKEPLKVGDCLFDKIESNGHKVDKKTVKKYWDLDKDGQAVSHDLFKIKCTYNIKLQQVHVQDGFKQLANHDESFEVWATHSIPCLNHYAGNLDNFKVRKSYHVASCIAVIDADK
jgi:hypothetical protein